MSVTDLRVGISLGGIGGLQDGLGEVALQIGTRIAGAAAEWRARHGVVFDFHLRKKLFGLFGKDVGYLPVTRWQRVRHVQPRRYALWHSLHQLNKTLPPAGSRLRMVTVHDLNYLYGRNAFSTWRHHRRTLALLARTDHVVAISQHTAADVRRLSFIRRGRNLGFSVEEIRSLLALSDQPDRDCGDALVIARQHLHDVEQRILELQNLRDALHAIANSCQLGRAADCGVLEAVGSNAFQG
mgnify:CR=1 FL=1